MIADESEDSEAPGTETEPEEERKAGETGDDSTTVETKKKPRYKAAIAPYLYTCMFNKREDLLFAGGAGKNELRVYDWATGNIVALVGNMKRPILCGAVANSSNKFAIGGADSRVRIFDIVETPGTPSMSARSSRMTDTYSQN